MLEPINLPEVEGGCAATSAELDAALADPGTIIVNDRPNRQGVDLIWLLYIILYCFLIQM